MPVHLAYAAVLADTRTLWVMHLAYPCRFPAFAFIARHFNFSPKIYGLFDVTVLVPMVFKASQKNIVIFPADLKLTSNYLWCETWLLRE